MEKSCSSSASLPLDSSEDDDFLKVVSILRQLKQLIGFQNRPPAFFPVDWGPVPRKRRSAEVKSLMRGGCSPTPEVAAVAGDAVESDSPVTPFTFSPSDTDEKPNRLKRKIDNSGTEKEEDESDEIQLKEGGIGMIKRKLSNKKEEIVQIPDLNIPVDDSEKSSTEAAIAAAEARQRRIQIRREKRSKVI